MTKNPHPISRATERYGVRLTRTDMQALEAQCAALKPVKRLPDGSEVKIVVHGRAPLVAVWKEGAIVTFLPRENYDMGSAPDAGRRMAESCPMMRPSPLTSERGTISASSTLQMPRRRTPRRCTISRTRSTTAAATMPGAAGSVAMAPRRPRSDSMTIAVSAAAPGARPAIRRRRRSKPAQIEAGNYSKRHLKWQGLGISIETEAGGIRRSKPGAKRPWEVTMEHPYGHILGTKGADGDPVDVFVGPGAILGGKTTPSYRRLVRRNGKSVDEMRRAAVEAGYLPPDADPNAPSTSTIADILEAIDRQERGQKVYAEYGPEAGEIAEMREAEAAERANDEFEQRHAEVLAAGWRMGIAMDAEIAERATEMMAADPKLDAEQAVDTAAERIAIEKEDEGAQNAADVGSRATQRADREPETPGGIAAGPVGEAAPGVPARGAEPRTDQPVHGPEAGAAERAPTASDEAVADDEPIPFQRSQRDDIEVLEEAIAKDVGPVPAGAFQAIQLPNHKALGKIASAFGKRIVGFAVRPGLGRLKHFNGVVLPHHPPRSSPTPIESSPSGTARAVVHSTRSCRRTARSSSRSVGGWS